VDRTTNGTGLVANMTLAQLQTLDAGSWFSPKFAGSYYHINSSYGSIGEKIPTLQEFLDWMETDGQAIQLVVLDLKVEELGAPLAKLLTNYTYSNRVTTCYICDLMI
jgi:glycerophosphoryl diester phosphodiesterase